MRSLPNESHSEVLRARYAELLRLREYVRRLENLHKEMPSPAGTMEGLEDGKKLLINAITKHGSHTDHRTI